MYKILRYCLFLFPTETSHYLTLNALKLAHSLGLTRLLFGTEKNAPTRVFGLQFKNPIGIGAGLDKNGDYIDALSDLNVGFIEVGAITPKPQVGNTKPRLFRLKKDQAIINRMGFNNKGVDHLVKNLANKKTTCLIGVNLGKNKDTPLTEAKDDYIYCLKQVYAYCDFLTINISSPNTPDLRKLQTAEYLTTLLQSVKNARDDCATQQQKYVPLLVKLSPDLNDAELIMILDTINHIGLEGIIATNTTTTRSDALRSLLAKELGGLSGKPLQSLSMASLQKIKQHSEKLPVISIGGIDSVNEANRRFAHGASLIQLYTGLIYQGPGLLKKILRSVSKISHDSS